MRAASGRSGAGKVAVIGAGIIGLSIAWRLAQRNIDVQVFDADASGQGASRAAAGMLSVVAEEESGDRYFFELCRAGRSLWPAFARELSQAGREDLDLREQGTLLVARSAHEVAALDALAQSHSGDGTLQRIEPADWKRREPNLTVDARAVYFAPEDGQVDNRAATRALVCALAELGVEIRVREPVLRLATRGEAVIGVETRSGHYGFDLVVLATGTGTDALMHASGFGEGRTRVTPVKGQTLALQMDQDAPLVRHVVRGAAHYLVPRSSGLLIVGATSEAGNFDLSVTQEANDVLIEGARALVPALKGLSPLEAWVGLRPHIAGGLPVIGESLPGLILALGHYRNGVLLAPITAELVAGAVHGSLDRRLAGLGAPFVPSPEHLVCSNK